MKKDEFLIHPIREADKELTKKIKNYGNDLKRKNIKIHIPGEDTLQTGDPIGIRICTDNALAIIPAKKVRVWFDKDSSGSKFDLGMAFVLSVLFSKKRPLLWRIKTIIKLFFIGEKIITLVNPDEVEPMEYKSFNNVLLALHEKYKGEKNE